MTEAPTPDLPRGAGGPPSRRAAGRVCPGVALPAAAAAPDAVAELPCGLTEPTAAVPVPAAAAAVLEPDPLVRLLVVPAAAALGFAIIGEAGAVAPGRHLAVVFVSLDRADDCRRVCAAPRGGAAPQGDPPLVVGYGTGPAPLLAAHRAHRCADLVLRLAAVGGRPCFVHLPAADAVTTAGLTTRESDVLLLLLGGLTTGAIAARLCVSTSTARSHCRAVLRKMGAGDRRALRARLFATPVDTPSAALVTALPRFAQASARTLPRNRP